MSGVDMAPDAITARLRAVSAAADLTPEHRLIAKLDLTPAGITQRLRRVSELRRLCRALASSRPISQRDNPSCGRRQR
jgi:hypothetical protein